VVRHWGLITFTWDIHGRTVLREMFADYFFWGCWFMNHMSQRFKDDRKGGSQVIINLVGRISHFCNSWSVEWLLRSWLTLAAGNLHLLYSWELFNLIWSFCLDTHSAGCCSFGLPLLLLWIFWIMGLLIWFPGDCVMSEWVNYGWIKNYRWSKSLLAVFGSHWRPKKKSNGHCCSFPSCCWQYLNSHNETHQEVKMMCPRDSEKMV
jgi:hypothetical protein